MKPREFKELVDKYYAGETSEEEEVEVEDEEEVFEVTIKGNTYYTSDAQNGEIYAIDEEGDPGDQIGMFKSGIAKFA